MQAEIAVYKATVPAAARQQAPGQQQALLNERKRLAATSKHNLETLLVSRKAMQHQHDDWQAMALHAQGLADSVMCTHGTITAPPPSAMPVTHLAQPLCPGSPAFLILQPFLVLLLPLPDSYACPFTNTSSKENLIALHSILCCYSIASELSFANI